MFGIFTVVFWVSLVLLLLGLVSPKLVSKLFRKDFSRKTVGKVFGVIVFVSIVGLIVVSPSTSTAPEIIQEGTVTTTQTNTAQEELVESYFALKFQQSTKATIQEFSIKDKVISITIAPNDNLEVVAIDCAIALLRHPEVEFERLVLKDSNGQVSFDSKLLKEYGANRIGDAQFMKSLEY